MHLWFSARVSIVHVNPYRAEETRCSLFQTDYHNMPGMAILIEADLVVSTLSENDYNTSEDYSMGMPPPPS